jgi:hypothetical protein
MKFDVMSHKSVGPVSFGMTRSEVRKALASPVHSFMRNEDDEAKTDEFEKLGVYVEYDSKDRCIAVEVFSPGEPWFQGRNLLGEPYAKIRAWIQRQDKGVEIDEAGLVSRKLGIGFYADIKPSDRASHPESAIAFKPGYYDE